MFSEFVQFIKCQKNSEQCPLQVHRARHIIFKLHLFDQKVKKTKHKKYPINNDKNESIA